MHILDLIMYFVTVSLLWKLIGLVTGGEWTEEIGGLVGMMICVVYTILYIIAFAFWPDWNWSDFSLSDFFLSLSKFCKW